MIGSGSGVSPLIQRYGFIAAIGGPQATEPMGHANWTTAVEE